MREILKTLLVCGIVLLCCFTLFLAIPVVYFYYNSDGLGPAVCGTVPEECYFVDYEIDGNRIKFRYAFTWFNDTDDDTMVEGFQCKFKRSEIKKWLDPDKDGNWLPAKNEIGDDSVAFIVPANSKCTVVLTFEGEYLGGEVNENLSYPIDCLMVMGDSRVTDIVISKGVGKLNPNNELAETIQMDPVTVENTVQAYNDMQTIRLESTDDILTDVEYIKVNINYISELRNKGYYILYDKTLKKEYLLYGGELYLLVDYKVLQESILKDFSWTNSEQ